MKKYTISIAEPCKVVWDEMTPIDMGKYCQQCDKKVVDFSGMTDREVIAYYERHGKVCGRFTSTQLNREMYTPSRNRLMPTAMLAAILAFVFPEKGKAQRVKVYGYVTDQKGNPLPGMGIVMKGTKMGAVSQADGSFYFTTYEGWKDSVTLIFQSFGVVPKEEVFYKAAVYRDVCVKLEFQKSIHGEVEVVRIKVPRWQFWKRWKRKGL